MIRHAVAEVEPDAAPARGEHLREHAAVVVENAVRGRRIHVADDVAALEQRQDRAHRRVRLADMDHHRQIEGSDRFLGPPERFEVAGVGDVVRQPRLHADDDIAMARNGAARETHVGAAQIVQLAAGRNARTRDVDQEAAQVRPRLRVGGPLVDAVRSERACIDVAGYAVQEAERRTLLGAGGVGMNVEEARRHDLAAGIDRFGGVGGDIFLDSGDAAARNRDVADSVDS